MTDLKWPLLKLQGVAQEFNESGLLPQDSLLDDTEEDQEILGKAIMDAVDNFISPGSEEEKKLPESVQEFYEDQLPPEEEEEQPEKKAPGRPKEKVTDEPVMEEPVPAEIEDEFKEDENSIKEENKMLGFGKKKEEKPEKVAKAPKVKKEKVVKEPKPKKEKVVKAPKVKKEKVVKEKKKKEPTVMDRVTKIICAHPDLDTNALYELIKKEEISVLKSSVSFQRNLCHRVIRALTDLKKLK